MGSNSPRSGRHPVGGSHFVPAQLRAALLEGAPMLPFTTRPETLETPAVRSAALLHPRRPSPQSKIFTRETPTPMPPVTPAPVAPVVPKLDPAADRAPVIAGQCLLRHDQI